MDELELHLGEDVRLDIELFDANGNRTTQFDDARGITYEIRNQADDTPDASGAVAVEDPDENPFDANVVLNELTDQAKYIFITVDGRVGPEENVFSFRSQPFQVVAGEAVSGAVQLRVVPAEG